MASTNIEMLRRTGNNEQSDECYTPDEAVLPLMPYLNKWEVHYDCTSGKSASIALSLIGSGFMCLTSGDRDFLNDELPEGVDIIISNPPYSKKDAFIKRCYDFGKPFALLLPVSAIQGQKRGQWFEEYGIELLVLRKRIDFTGKNAPHFGVAWFCHNILHKPLIFV